MRGIKAVPESQANDLATYVARRGDWLAACAFLLTRDREAALDLVQDALLLAWRAWDRVVAADDQERYILRIMLNQFRSHQRRPGLRVVSLEQQPAVTGVDVAADVADAHVLAGAVAVLSDRQRAVVVLRYWADYDDQEIAEILGCRRATVRSLAARSMHKLRGYLES